MLFRSPLCMYHDATEHSLREKEEEEEERQGGGGLSTHFFSLIPSTIPPSYSTSLFLSTSSDIPISSSIDTAVNTMNNNDGNLTTCITEEVETYKTMIVEDESNC